MSESEIAKFIESVLTRMSNNPSSPSHFIIHFENGDGFRGVLLAWNSFPHPTKDVTKLLKGAIEHETLAVKGLAFDLDWEDPGNWLLLWSPDPESDADETWSFMEAMTESEVREFAESIDDSESYGAYHEFRIIRAPRLPAPLPKIPFNPKTK